MQNYKYLWWEVFRIPRKRSFSSAFSIYMTVPLKLKSYAIAFSFAWFYLFFNDHFLLFILASVAANHKTTTESDVFNKIARVLKYAPDKIVVGVAWKDGNDEWDWIIKFLWIWTTLYENGSSYGITIQFCSNFPHKYAALISIIKLSSK